MASIRSASFSIFLLVMISAASPWLASCTELHPDTPEYSYDSDSPTGPQHWGDLSPTWSICSNGRSQSPINIYKKHVAITKDQSSAADIDHLCFNYTASHGHGNLHLGTHDVGVEWMEEGAAGAIYWKGVEYKLLELHTHSPSEHKVKNQRFPMEMHLVHRGPGGKLLVIALLFKYGEASSLLEEIVHELPGIISGAKRDHLLRSFSLDGVKFGAHYYHYAGSLTTPPCTEGVTWIIMKKAHSISPMQVHVIMNAQEGDNARPLQAPNGRIVYRND